MAKSQLRCRTLPVLSCLLTLELINFSVDARRGQGRVRSPIARISAGWRLIDFSRFPRAACRFAWHACPSSILRARALLAKERPRGVLPCAVWLGACNSPRILHPLAFRFRFRALYMALCEGFHEWRTRVECVHVSTHPLKDARLMNHRNCSEQRHPGCRIETKLDGAGRMTA